MKPKERYDHPRRIDYIRTAAIGDMLGDPGALDEMGQRYHFRLCRELERMDREADWLIRERIVAEWNGRFVGAPNAAKDGYVIYRQNPKPWRNGDEPH